jgi:hypothetical protein
MGLIKVKIGIIFLYFNDTLSSFFGRDLDLKIVCYSFDNSRLVVSNTKRGDLKNSQSKLTKRLQ